MWSDQRKVVLGVNVAFFILTWITVGLRMVVRVGMLRAFGSDVSIHLIVNLKHDVDGC
jgi:hypothetical protein